jgi:hypothetical protein
MPKSNKAEQAESRQFITNALERATKDHEGKPIIYTVLRSVSRSGMQRKITVFVINDGEPDSLSWHYDRAYGRMADDSSGRWANKVGGCGMDMGFHLAGNLSQMAGRDSYSTFRHEWI